MFPITMPYSPGKAIAVYCEDFLTDKKNGDLIQRYILALNLMVKKSKFNRFFKESEVVGMRLTRLSITKERDGKI